MIDLPIDSNYKPVAHGTKVFNVPREEGDTLGFVMTQAGKKIVVYAVS